MIVLHSAISILLVIALIIRVRVDPVISLVLGSLYLGLAAGVGFTGTLEAITSGFGEIMAKVGLLIGFGVLIGSLLHATGAFRRIVTALVSAVGPVRLPYAMAAVMSTIFPSIYVDVQVVLASPVARATARHVGPIGLPLLAGAIGTGIFSGYVFVVPGLAVLLIAGQVDVSLGAWLVWGLLIGLTTALVTTFLYHMLLRSGYWKPASDEDPDAAMEEVEAHDRESAEVQDARMPSLPISVAPIVVPLMMIALGAFAKLAGVTNDFIDFIGNANLALFVGLLGAYVLARRSIGVEPTNAAISEGFHTSGEILLITGVGGALGAVITASGMDDELAKLFSADASGSVLLTILLAWFIAAVLHVAIGSVSVAALTAAGIIGPIIPQLSVSPVVIGLAIASGALFAVHVNSNFFWMFKALLGLSTAGALKTLSVVTSLASLVSLPLVMLVSVVL
ncbi:TRAP transporter large permease subunit [Rubellimicrobium rubrum]|uniref:TRAP transporter large permease subunit n=1 Tax=Rubellimicrobium rubrum TaxID=2585369 RepID=A0A5C4MNN7_9RHOB|nr:SLC13 family permease [Rubellimicrobium rubrum]TNC46222.1 TRAP transporter large permease subunit [Rubellimicrobium rubrum]